MPAAAFRRISCGNRDHAAAPITASDAPPAAPYAATVSHRIRRIANQASSREIAMFLLSLAVFVRWQFRIVGGCVNISVKRVRDGRLKLT